MTVLAASAAYLADAAESGLLWRLDAHAVVSGPYDDPVTNARICLVEHVDPALLDDVPRLLGALAERYPDCAETIVRLPAGTGTPEGLTPYVDFVVLPPDPVREAALPGEVLVGADENRDWDDLVGGWLAEAMHRFTTERGTPAEPAGVRAAVEQVLGQPDRVSYVITRPDDEKPVGHATLLLDAHDEPSGTDIVELVDILIGDPGLMSAGTNAAVEACARRAAAAGRPLLGNVCHGIPVQERTRKITAGLQRRGWVLSHQYWHAPLSHPTGRGPQGES